ncbi:MAG: hypothetical protein ACLPYZ_05555 [Limisphaerales bacterium]
MQFEPRTSSADIRLSDIDDWLLPIGDSRSDVAISDWPFFKATNQERKSANGKISKV